MRCFLHICNLVAKSLLRLFDNAKGTSRSDNDQDFAKTLHVETEDQAAHDSAAEEHDDEDGMIDPMSNLDKYDRESKEEEFMPVRTVLIKVCL